METEPNCHRLALSNIPFDITEEELVYELVTAFPSEFQHPNNQGTLKVRILPVQTNARGQKSRKALATGFVINLKGLEEKAAGKTLRGRNWIIKQDGGGARAEDGTLIKKPIDVLRAEDNLRGINHRKTLIVLHPTLSTSLDKRVFSGTNSVYFQGNPADKELQKCGSVQRTIQTTKYTKIEYYCALEALQAISFLHGQDNVRVCDVDGREHSTIKLRRPLGRGGRFLDAKSFQEKYGFVPFAEFGDGLINIDKLNNLGSLCWKCKGKYKLIGVDMNFNFIAGDCRSCKYITNLDVSEAARAYFWGNEKFTRLILGGSEKQASNWLIIWHQPMKSEYKDEGEYRKIVSPIIQEEWKYASKDYKTQNRCTGQLESIFLVETIQQSERLKTDVYSLQIRVPQNKFWNSNNFEIEKITLHLELKDTRTKRIIGEQKRKAKFVRIFGDGETCLVVANIVVDSTVCLVRGSTVRVIPKPIKTTYSGTRKLLNMWHTTPERYPFLSTVLNPRLALEFREDHDQFIRKDAISGTYKASLTRLTSRLNSPQLIGLQRAIGNPTSVVQGPPGTGKSYFGATAAAVLSAREKGHIILSAPSNFATNSLAIKTAQACSAAHFPVSRKVLRIFSKRRERQMLSTNITEDLGPNVKILHEEVRRSPDWLAGPEFAGIRRKLATNHTERLTSKEEKLLESHVSKIERETMAQYHFFAGTINSFGDRRVFSYSWPNKIGSVIIDEAGMLKQTDALKMFTFNQRRLLIIGDQMQLRAMSSSRSATTAGIVFSIMDWMKMSNSEVPWTLLTVQHRMNPTNSSLVSNLTYNGRLEDAAVVRKPPHWVKVLMESGFAPAIKSQVVVYNHRFFEKEMDFSFKNEGEISLTVGLANHLIRKGIIPDSIVVLSLYESHRDFLSKELRLLGVNVHTVDSFQGKESDIIILNMVRGGTGEIGFASNLNRLNVALSRSKHLLFVACNVETFSNHRSQTIVRFIELLERLADIRVPKKSGINFEF